MSRKPPFRTTFIGSVSPFTLQPVPQEAANRPRVDRRVSSPGTKPRRNPTKYVDMDNLEVTNDPLPSRKREPEYKYDKLFSGMEPGQCIKCPSDYVQRMQHALATWIKRKGKQDTLRVRSIRRYNDTDEGRVWLLAKEDK